MVSGTRYTLFLTRQNYIDIIAAKMWKVLNSSRPVELPWQWSHSGSGVTLFMKEGNPGGETNFVLVNSLPWPPGTTFQT